MRVLIGFAFSDTVRAAFASLGHDVTSCDLLPSECPGPHHYQGDIRDILYDGWDMAICFPPCTYLANSGVRWLYGGKGTVRDETRWAAMTDASALFRLMLDAAIERIAVENPIQHRYARELIGAKPTQIVQPWMFGHGETKATCLWLKNLPPLMPTCIVAGREQRVHLMPPGPDRWRERSRTPQGLALAMAAQWGQLMPVPETT